MGKILGLVIGGVIVIGGLWWFLGRGDTSSEMMMEKEVMMEKEGVMAPDSMPKDKMMEGDKMAMDKATSDTSGAMMPEKKMEGSGDTMMMSKGAYVEYAPGVLEESKATKRVLFFYASWCPNCKPTDAEFREKTSMIPENVTVIRVNYNDPQTDQAEKDLAAQYGVTYQHTFVQIDQEGKVVTKWNGGKLDELLKNIK